jgi:hypothetical protein
VKRHRFHYRVHLDGPDPRCDFYFPELRPVVELEETWHRAGFEAHVVSIIDRETSRTLYTRAQA